jgi:hypothetical protein
VDDSTRQFDQLKRSVAKIWSETKRFFAVKYETVSAYPIFAYVASAARRVYRVAAAVANQFSLDAQFRRMAENVFGQVSTSS